MAIEYAVKAETKEGNVLTLRRGFTSQEAAEDHPVQIKLWKRVWVEPVGNAPTKPKAPPRHRKSREDFQAEIDAAFISMERAAAKGVRCPVNKTFDVTSYRTMALAKAGRIKIEVYAHNWRVVTILTGPHAGKTTAMPPYKHGRPYRTITKEGEMRVSEWDAA